MAYRVQRTFLTLLLFLIAGTASLVAQNTGKPFSSPNFPVPFGPNNIGTEFYTAFPANWEFQATQKYIRFYISAGVATKVDIYALGIFKGSITTIPNEIVTFDLSNLEAQMFVRNDQAPLPDDQTYIGKAVRIVSEDPIVVYALNRTDYTSDGMLVLPVNALGREYVVASAASVAGGFQELPSQYMIIAPYDNTIVSVVNPMNTPNHAEGQNVVLNLNKGDVYSAMSVGFSGDLSGAVIRASKPIAVTAGQNCTYLPSFEYPACDHIVEMLTPVESWGKSYQAVPYQNRTKGDTYRIFAGEPNAEVYINGDKIATLSSVGGRSGFGWIEYREENRRPLEFTSNKRIFVAQYNNSQTYDNAGGSDPFFIILTPIEQYQDELIFTTPGADFPQNFITIIGDSATIANTEITRAGQEKWENLSLLGAGAMYNFPTRINGLKYVGVTTSITPGAYQLRSTGPVAGYIYAGNNFDSYGYPLSVATANLALEDYDAPPITKEEECDGSVAGMVRDMPDEDAVRSNLSTIRLRAGSVNYVLTVDPFVANVTRQTSFTLKVRDPKQDAVAIVEATDAAGNVSLDTIRYFARNIALTPDPLDFGEVVIGGSKDMEATIRNNGNRTIDIKNVLAQKGNVGFEIIDPTGEFSLNPGEERKVTVRFGRDAQGVYLDSLGFADSCGTFWVTLLRAEVVAPVISVSDWDFGPWPINQPITQSLTIQNTGTGTLTVSGVRSNLTNPVFTISGNLPAFPLNLKAGERRQFTVQFLPTAEQKYKDSIVFEHNAPDNPANDPAGIVEGEGIQATLFATSYEWEPKRVGTGPYIATIYIRNVGSQDAKVFGVKTAAVWGDLQDFNVDDEAGIRNITIPAGGEIPVQVSFSPKDIGERMMKVIFNVTDESDTTLFSTLTGTGLVPGLGTEDLNFGSMLVNDPEVMRTVDFSLIRNYPASITGDYRDTVWIEGFEFVSDDDGMGNEDFRYDAPAGGFPIVLIPRQTESVTITGYFSAKAAGARNASIRALTRDGVDTTSRWTGVGGVQNSGASVTVSPGPSLCVGETDSIFVTISSDGDTTLTVTGITLNDLNGEFVLNNPPATPFEIVAGDSRRLLVLFTAKQNGARSATLTVTTDDPNNRSIQVQLEGEGSFYSLAGQMVLTGTDPTTGHAVLGENVTATVLAVDDLTPVGATGYRVTMKYDARQLIPPAGAAEITLNPTMNPAGTVVAIDPSSTYGTLVLNVTSPQPLTGAGGLLSVPFGVIFDTTLVREISAELEFTTGAKCATIDINDGQISVTRICGLNLRLIELVPGGKYALNGATPNPVSAAGSEVEYAIGLDGPTRLALYDASGNFTALLVDQYQQPGLYRVGFDATALSSGLYYCVLESGHYREVKPVLITK